MNKRAFAQRTRARIDQRSKPLAVALSAWLKKAAKYFTERAIADLRERKELKKSAQSDLEKELLDILTAFGVRNIDSAGRRTALALKGEWTQSPGLVERVIQEKEIAVQNILKQCSASVQRDLKELISQGVTDGASVGELARRIRTQYLGDNAAYVFSNERAALIARTELAQDENTGIFEGYSQSGIEEIEWLWSGSANPGAREHNKMDGERVKVGEHFTTPLGNKMLYPGDPSAPIEELANCGCTTVPVWRSRK